MKASERKNKSPSEYYNPYFKRGHPNLLWLINKPKGGNAQKKGGKGARIKTEDGGERDSDDDERDGMEEPYGQGYGQASLQGTRAISAVPESGPLQRREMAIVQHQVHDLQKQQAAISGAINRLRKDHNQLYQQAVAFQTLHDRHESSINAILTFLATVYNRSLDGQGGPNIAQMFGQAMPQDQQHHGDVVDIGDLSNRQQSRTASPSPNRRQQRLLMAPPANGQQVGRFSSASPADSTGSPRTRPPHPRSDTITEIEDGARGSPQIKTEQYPQQDILNLINATNAGPNGSDGMEFPDILSHYEHANGNSPLTTSQRNDMLSLINKQSPTDGVSNALTSPAPEPPSLGAMAYTQAELEQLTAMQEAQAAKLSELSSLIQPLSPGGAITNQDGSQYFPPEPGANLDLDQFLDTGAYYTNGEGGDYSYNDNADFDFNFDPASGEMFGTDDAGRIVETTGSSEAASPAELAEAVDGGAPSPKRRRQG